MSSDNDNDKIVSHYLNQLRQALSDLPARRREPIIEEIAEHIRTGRDRLAHDDEVSVRQLLESLGDYESIRREAGLSALPGPSRFDPWVPWLLLFGGFLFGVGWFVGLVMLWESRVFSLRDKLLGTFIWPGGLFGTMILLGLPSAATSCSGSSTGSTHCVTTGFHLPQALGLPVLALSVILPIIVAAMLFRRIARLRA